jgi:hypothetical protein
MQVRDHGGLWQRGESPRSCRVDHHSDMTRQGLDFTESDERSALQVASPEVMDIAMRKLSLVRGAVRLRAKALAVLGIVVVAELSTLVWPVAMLR